MNQISCNVCVDLMPLVKDGIASEESCALVMNHIEICEDCAKALGGKTEANPAMNDAVVLIKLKKQITLFYSVLFLLGH